MKKILSILLVIIIMFSLTGCSEKKEEQTDAQKFKEEYEKLNNQKREKDGKKIRSVSIPEDNPMVYATTEEIIEKLDNKETFAVYFGFNDCPWCRSIIEELIKAAKDSNVEKIYYVDVKEIRDVKELDENNNIVTTKEGDKYYLELIKKMENVLEDYNLIDENGNQVSTGEKRIYAPNLVGVSKGKALELKVGTSEELTDPYGELTEEMRKESYNNLKCVFKCLDEESTTCKKNMC